MVVTRKPDPPQRITRRVLRETRIKQNSAGSRTVAAIDLGFRFSVSWIFLASLREIFSYSAPDFDELQPRR